MRGTLLYPLMTTALIAAGWAIMPQSISEGVDAFAQEWFEIDLGLTGAPPVDRAAVERMEAARRAAEAEALVSPPPVIEEILPTQEAMFEGYETLAVEARAPIQPRWSWSRGGEATPRMAGRFLNDDELAPVARRAPSRYVSPRTSLRDRLYSLRTRTRQTFSQSTIKPQWLRDFGRSLDRSRADQRGNGGHYVPPHLNTINR